MDNARQGGSESSKGCLICGHTIPEGHEGLDLRGVCFDCGTTLRPIPIHWDGVIVGFIVDAKEETMLLRAPFEEKGEVSWKAHSSKRHGRWKPVDSPTLHAFLKRLERPSAGRPASYG